MTIRSKLIMNSSVAMLTIGILAVILWMSLHHLASLQDEGAQRMRDAAFTSKVSLVGEKVYNHIADAIINKDLIKNEKEWQEIKAEIAKDMAACEKIADTPKEKEQVAATKKALDEMSALFETRLLPILKSNANGSREREIKEIDEEIDARKSVIQRSMSGLTESINTEAIQGDKKFDDTIGMTKTVSFIVGFLGLVIFGVLTWKISREILSSIRELHDGLYDIAQAKGI